MPDEVACRWGLTPADGVAEDLQQDGLSLLGRPAVPLEAAMDWASPPIDHASWHFQLHALQWTYPLVVEAAGGDSKARNLLTEVYESWHDANGDRSTAATDEAWKPHAVAMRSQVMTCAVHTLDLPSARRILAGDVAWLADDENDDGPWNHGVDQAIALLMAGCTLDDEDSVDVAVERLDRHRVEAIDDQGVTNEQAIDYQRYVYRQYRDIVDVLAGCGLDHARFDDARESLLPLMVHAIRPSGTMAPLGDTPPAKTGISLPGTPLEHAITGGQAGPEPESRVGIFTRGYAFGRDAWERDATWFALRFGEGRRIHGHRDHTSLLYDVQGKPVLAEAGFSGYQPGDWRDWERSHAAHNVVTVVDGGRFLWDHETPLVHRDVRDDTVSLTVTGRPYTRIEEHRRSVLVSFDPHVVVIRDLVTAPNAMESNQLWHLPLGWTVDQIDAARASAAGPDGLGLRIVQLAAAGSGRVVTGQEDPIQGFVATGQDERVAAPTLVFGATGNQVERLTVLVPTGPDLPGLTVTYDRDAVRVADDHGTTLTVRIEDGNLLPS